MSQSLSHLMSDRNKLLEDKLEHLEDKMSQSFETLSNQLTNSNAAVAKCISDLSTRMGHLRSKVLDANEEKVNQIFLERKVITSKEGEPDVAAASNGTSS